MEPAPLQPRSLDLPEFADGLGDRILVSDPHGGDNVEVLRLRASLTAVPSFEFALRERTARLANFRHAYFARIRRIDRTGATGLAIVSDQVGGSRLSEMLRIATERSLVVDTNAALCLIRQLVPAIALLHENARDVAHGALGPERLIVTPHARLIVAEYVLGSALEQLQLSHDRLWNEHGIPMPPSAGVPRFDHRADIMQIGMISLALIVGRPLRTDEFPGRIPELLAESTETSAGGARQPLSQGLRGWLARALQLDPRRPFLTARDAQVALDQLIGSDPRFVASTVAVEAFMSRCADSVIGIVSEPSFAPAVAPIQEAPVTPPEAIPELPVVPAPMSEQPQPAVEPEEPPAQPEPTVTHPPAAPQFDLDRLQATFGRGANSAFADPASEETTEVAVNDSSGGRPWLRIVAILAVVLVTGTAGVFGFKKFVAGVGGAYNVGTLAVQSTPAGVPVFVDGVEKGKTPASLVLTAGPHIVELRGKGVPRVLPVTITAHTTVSQFVEFAEASAPATGQLDVRSDPPGARVLVDGQPAGVAPVVLTNLSPGDHVVVLQREDASVQHTVSIQAGATATLVAPVAPAAPAGPASGWVSITAPFAMQVYEDGRLVGSTETDRIMVAAGKHTFDITNESTGYRVSRVVQVQPGKVATIGIELPNGLVNLNAQPWAEVWIDAKRVGETPIGNLSLPIGPHEVVFRHPELGERRQAIQVTTENPVRLSIDMRKQ